MDRLAGMVVYVGPWPRFALGDFADGRGLSLGRWRRSDLEERRLIVSNACGDGGLRDRLGYLGYGAEPLYLLPRLSRLVGAFTIPALYSICA
jgi:hypothetical protein